MSLAKIFSSAQNTLLLMLFWGQIQNYMMRVNIALLIVDMVKQNETSTNEQDAGSPRFDWNYWKQGLVLGAFSYGYTATQLIGGRLAEVFGFKLVYGLCLLLTGFLSVLTPLVTTHLPFECFITLRVIQGLFEGVTFPCCHVITSRWVEPEKRSSFIARSYFGTTFGLIITYPICGYMSHTYGWESAFYLTGAITSSWFVLWWILVFDCPTKHPRIDKDEKERIVTIIGSSVVLEKKKAVPWMSILTSVPFWGLLIADCSNSWGIGTLLILIPSYLKDTYDLDIKTNGLISGLPFLARYIGGVVLAYIADILTRKHIVSITNIRRIFNSITAFSPAIPLLIFALAPIKITVTITVTLLSIGMFFNGALSAGHFSSHVDLAPNFAGTLMGITNTFSGGGTGFLVPTVAGAILAGDTYSEAVEWKIIFCLAAGIWSFGNIIYVFTIKGTEQEWNRL